MPSADSLERSTSKPANPQARPTRQPAAPAAKKTSAPMAGLGGGLGSDTSGQSDAQIIERIRRDYPHLAIYLDHPELGRLLLDWARSGGQAEELQGLLYNTEWWRTTSPSARAWDRDIALDPGKAKQTLYRALGIVENLATRLGIELDSNTHWKIADAYIRFDWSEVELNRTLGSYLLTHQGDYGPGYRLPQEGEARDLANRLRAQAGDYMVTPTPDEVVKWVTGIVSGTMTEDGWRSHLQRLALAKFPDLVDEINQGVTPGEFFHSYRQSIGQLFGQPLEAIDLANDPRFKQITNFVDESGKRRIMTIPEAEAWARSQHDFRVTPYARDLYGGMTQSFLQSMGEIGA